jgi:hypothetical protein
MLRKVSNLVGRLSSGAVTLLALVVFMLFTILVLPRQSAGGTGGEEARAPDLSFYYTADELNRMAEAYGAAGREEYVQARYRFDILWPLVYTLFLSTSISWLAKRSFLPGSPWQQANLVPILGMFFDLLENLATSAVMIHYPRLLPVTARLAGFFTLIKWALVGSSFLLLLACLAAFLWNMSKGRRAK